jgi:hypothetical protein
LFEQNGKAHTRPTGDSPAAFGDGMLSAVPLWKVIVGPCADKLRTGPPKVRFFFARERGTAACPKANGCLVCGLRLIGSPVYDLDDPYACRDLRRP